MILQTLKLQRAHFTCALQFYALLTNFVESDPTSTLFSISKVSRSVSDVSELTSTATSLMSRKFDRFEEKRRQQLDKRTKAVKSIFRKSQSNKG